MEPGHGMADGLRPMKWLAAEDKKADILKMAEMSATLKSLRIYIDEANILKSEQSPNDVLEGNVVVLPSVLLSPCRRKPRRAAEEDGGQELPEVAEGVMKDESDIEDNDCNFSEQDDESDDSADDNDYKHNIDEEVQDGERGKRLLVRYGQMMEHQKMNICSLYM